MLALDASPHQWEISVALADERKAEASALFSVLGRAHGLQRVGESNFEPGAGLDRHPHRASHVPKPQQLQVLAKVARERSADGSLVAGVELDGWADSLLNPTLTSDRGVARESLLQSLGTRAGPGSFRPYDVEDLLDPLPRRSSSSRSTSTSSTPSSPCSRLRCLDQDDQGLPRPQRLDVSITRKRFSSVRVDRGPVPVAALLAPSLVLQVHGLRPTAERSRLGDRSPLPNTAGRRPC